MSQFICETLEAAEVIAAMSVRIKRETVEPSLDRDRLAQSLQDRMDELGLSIRTAAPHIGCSAATLGRLLQGAASANVPDTVNVIRAASWLGKSLSDFEIGAPERPSTLADVRVHLRGLEGISNQTADAIFAMVKAAYDSAPSLQQGKKPRR